MQINSLVDIKLRKRIRIMYMNCYLLRYKKEAVKYKNEAFYNAWSVNSIVDTLVRELAMEFGIDKEYVNKFLKDRTDD